MPVDIEVNYSPSLTEAERQMLLTIESLVAEYVWSLRSIPCTRWWPKQDDHGRSLYCLTPYNEPTSIIVYYTDHENAHRMPEVIKNDIALGYRSELPTGFFDRPGRE